MAIPIKAIIAKKEAFLIVDFPEKKVFARIIEDIRKKNNAVNGAMGTYFISEKFEP